MRGWIQGLTLAALLLALAPVAGADDYDPCTAPAPRTPRIIIGFVKSPRFLFWGGRCKAYVHPGKKKVCHGDTVSWSVINTCDATTFSSILIPDLDDLTTAPCSAQTVAHLGIGAVEEIRCTLKTDISAKAKYSVATGTRTNHRLLIDPELVIRTPD